MFNIPVTSLVLKNRSLFSKIPSVHMPITSMPVQEGKEVCRNYEGKKAILCTLSVFTNKINVQV